MQLIKLEDAITRNWVDFSSLSAYITCPRRYWWQCIQSVSPLDVHPALTNGRGYHASIASYHIAKLAGATHEEAVEAGIKSLVPIMEEIKVEDPDRNTPVAISTMKNYFERHKNDTGKPLYVETGGAVDLGDIVYVGLIDLIIELQSFGITVRETKSTTVVGERWQLRGNPNMQIDGYLFMASVLLDINIFSAQLDVIPVHHDASKRKLPFRIFTTRSEKDLAAWHKDVVHWARQIAMCKERNYFPRWTDACIPLRGSDCPYTLLCRKYPDPHTQEVALELPREYTIRPWLPLESMRMEAKTEGSE